MLKAKAKALTFKAKDLILKAKAKDSKFVLEDTPRPRTKAKDNNTGIFLPYEKIRFMIHHVEALTSYFASYRNTLVVVVVITSKRCDIFVLLYC